MNDEITPAEVVEACDALMPFAEGLAEQRPEVWTGEAVAFLRLLRDLAQTDLH